MQPIAQTFFVAGHQARQLLSSRRFWMVVVIALLPPFLAHLTVDPERPMHHFAPVAVLLSLNILAPLAGLLLGSTVISEEVEAKTLTYVFTRPIPRVSLFLGRWLACTLVVSAVLAISGAYVGWHADQFEPASFSKPSHGPLPAGLAMRFVGAMVLCGALYTTLAAGLSTTWRRPIVFGLGYAFVWEMVVANLPGSTQRLSMQYYLRGLLIEPSPDSFERRLPPFILQAEYLPPLDSLTRLLGFMVFLLIVGSFTVRRKQYLLSS